MERQVSLIESGPFNKDAGRKFFLATEEERQDLQQQFPMYSVRLANPEEIDQLHGKTWDQMEAEEIATAIAMHQ